MFDATFDNVRTVIDRTVNQEGRIPRLSEYKGYPVAVVILENAAPKIEGTISCGGGTMQQSELHGGYCDADPTTEDVMEAI